MKFRKKLFEFILILSIFIPVNVFAYSDRIILGGDNVGIKVNSKYVMVVGFYKVDDKYIAEDAGIRVGDFITKINNKKINSINDMVDIINTYKDEGDILLTYLRNNKETTVELPLIKDNNNVYKTGLYVKDEINGIGTLTYVDPETGIFGALGHEIAEKNTFKKVEISDGSIYKSEVTGIKRSEAGEPGSKEAKLFSDEAIGNILTNTDKGIFGIFNEKVNSKIIEVGNKEEIKLGEATIYTVLDNFDIKEYKIKIIDIDKNNPTKNILFEIIDKDLLLRTGGVVAGMSGSPIIQNNKIIGAVTHVVVNEPNKGYGIFITTMLEEGDKKE